MLTAGSSPVPHRVGPSHRVGDLLITEMRFSVPLTHAWEWTHQTPYSEVDPGRLGEETIELFTRVVTRVGGTEGHGSPEDRPYLLYLQGGPGMPSPRPLADSGWVGHMANTYRVVLMDQRGTGLSTPLTAQSLALRGNASQQVAYLEHFRADSIVADAEAIRATLTHDEHEKRWATLGQSFGGFITLSYLSFAPESLLHSWMTAGLAPINCSPREVYEATFERMAERNRRFYDWYPEDRRRAGDIATFLAEREAYLPTGERLTPHRFQMVGHRLGGTSRVHGLHYLLESAFSEGEDRLSESFLTDVGQEVTFSGRPLYALMHEAIYCDGPGIASRWAADQTRHARGDYDDTARPLLFTGEMIHPWYFQEDPALRPLAETAELLATKDDWGRLYDLEVLRSNEVPVAASAYRPDVYVDYSHAMDTASTVRNLATWTSDTLHHDALGNDTELVLGALGNLLKDADALTHLPVSPGHKGK
ncbi:alpha/beta fold hydrolase [Curtobacterium sp. S6]|uniref:alpha/beta fold hydrolase n=1 Tax=Curtobacterium sp. S6 TaxID=1479623 RepID=UPI00068C069B|nr:alpha/beta fold hydrolase [Curtobacterium sp. S6]